MILLPLLLILISSVEPGKECEFAMRLVPGFNPLRQVDSNGKECRGNVELPFCKGYCKTSEVGILWFLAKFWFSPVSETL
ncbi:unnamed protein product [Caenorhabditis brenneri]